MWDQLWRAARAARWPLLVPACLLGCLVTSGGGKELTHTNWDLQTAGRIVFVNFFSPKCGFCKMLEPHWTMLMEDYEGAMYSGVYEVNCGTTGKVLCAELNIRRTPALKYGNASAGKDKLKDFPLDGKQSDGGRNYESLKRFAEQHLGPVCGLSNMEHCRAEERAMFEEFRRKPAEELSNEVARLQAKFKEQDKEHRKRKADFDDRQQQFEAELKDLKAQKSLLDKAAKKSGQNSGKAAERENAKREERRKKLQGKSEELEQIRQELVVQREALDRLRSGLDEDIRQSGLRFMRLALESMGHRADEL